MLGDEPEAEATCTEAMRRALVVDPASPQALQTMASICISQQKSDDALKFLQRSLAVWHAPVVECVDSVWKKSAGKKKPKEL